MGKASKTKVKAKRKWNNDKDNIIEEPLRWEELMSLKEKTDENVLNNYAWVKSMVENGMEILEEEPKLKSVLVGTLKSFVDVIHLLRQNIENHCTFGENGEIIDNKKGVIDPDSEEYLDFIGISSDYLLINDQIAKLTTSVFLELQSILAEKDATTTDDIEKSGKELNELREKVNEGVNLIKELKDKANGTEQPK